MGTVLGARDTNQKKKKKTTNAQRHFFSFICLIPSYSNTALTSIHITWAVRYT